LKIFKLYLFTFILANQFSFAQQTVSFVSPEINHCWTIGASFFNEFNLNGYIAVRENQFVGDKLSLLNDLGMKQWRSIVLNATYLVKNNSLLTFSFEDFFFYGHAVFNKSFWYNGTKMSGIDGLSPSPTQLYRTILGYEKKFNTNKKYYSSFCFDLVRDGLIFYIDGKVLPDTYRNEPYENFSLHSLPFPFAGAKLYRMLSESFVISVEVSGTYIPLFKSFFYEGGNMYLQYSTAQGGLDYNRSFKKFNTQLSFSIAC
jgi:hypothetical protein